MVAVLFAASTFAQTDRALSFGTNPAKLDYYQLEFPVVSTTDYITGYVHTTGLTYTATVTDPRPCQVLWYIAMDSIKSASGTDSINVDVKWNHKKFAAESYTTLKTIAVDLDANGDYASAVLDSSYIIPTGSGDAGNKNIPLARPEFSRIFQLSITPTSGAGVGKLNDKVVIKKVYCKVIYR